MEPNSSTANPDPATPVVEAPVDKPAEYSNPNDLATEMTAEEEAAFVDATLGIKAAKSEPVVAEPVAPAEEPETPVVPAETPPAPKEPETPTVVAPVEPEAPVAPTEITAPSTDDLWIEIQDSEGNAVKLTFDPANPNSFLPADFTFKDDNQLFEILDAKSEMANLYKSRVSEYEAATTAAAEKANTASSEAEQTAAWDAEIADLIEGGFLEAPKTKQGDANFMEDPTVQKIDEVFKFMGEQNKARIGEGKPVLRSFGTAFNLYNKQSEAAIEERKQQEANELAKARGALVGGSSSPSNGGDAPLYKIGSAKSAWQAVQDIE